MSEFTLKLHTDEPEPQIQRTTAHGTRWLWLDDAARLLGLKNVGTLRNKCLSTWGPKLLARKAKDKDGQEKWQVSELADPRLIQVKPAEDRQALDLGSLTDEQRRKIIERERVVTEWQKFLDAGELLGQSEALITPRFISSQEKAGIKLSRGTLYRWRAAYRDSGRVGLIDPRWHIEGQGARDEHPIYTETLKRIFLNQRQLSKRQCHERACAKAEEAGETPPSYKTAQRILNAIPRDTVILLREGETAYTNKVAKFIQRDYTSFAVNEWWVSDNMRFDVIVRTPDGELCRPWLHSWMDMRSRLIVGYEVMLHDANAELVLRVLRRAIRRHGKPLNAYLDNGREYDNRVMQGRTKQQRHEIQQARRVGALDVPARQRVGGAFGNLGIDVTHAEAYHGQSKNIERWHRRIHDQFDRDFASYCGTDVTRKPDDLAEKLATDQIPTLEYFATAFEQWVDGYNSVGHMGHGMDGKSPRAVYAECLVAERPVDEASLRLACSLDVTCTVRQNGVFWQGVSWHSFELDPLIGQKVRVFIDTERLDDVVVCRTDGSVICLAKADRRVAQGASSQDIREAKAEMRRNKKKVRAYFEARPRMALDTVELMQMRQAKLAKAEDDRVAATGTDDVPPTIQPARTPFDDQSNALRSAIDRAAPMPRPTEDLPTESARFRYVRPPCTEDDEP